MSTTPQFDVTAEKAALRSAAAVRRAEAHGEDAAGKAARLARHALALVPADDGIVVSAYAAMRDEIDPLPLLAELAGRGCRIALPVVTGAGQPLVFRAWAPGAPLVPAPFGTRVPPETAEVLVPDVVLVPMLAFDRRGYRLGYGGGFYDRTLTGLREANEFLLALGLAYAEQEVPRLPTEDHDAPLDAIVTPDGVVRPGLIPPTRVVPPKVPI
ncbi:MAG: 5-formyltetrahydrofolate cyclo-ligase [Rhodospirillaceae bacterium]|nr:5-formyltetrahydrofolate cyclo-ligase [Rhodospirillaceae bacterium]